MVRSLSCPPSRRADLQARAVSSRASVLAGCGFCPAGSGGTRCHPPVRSKRPAHVREATKRLVGPSGLACGGEDHETPCCLHAHPSDDHRLALAPQERDRIIDLRSSKEGLGGVHAFVTWAAISLSRTARSPPEDLIRYETSPVWSAGMRRVTS